MGRVPKSFPVKDYCRIKFREGSNAKNLVLQEDCNQPVEKQLLQLIPFEPYRI